MAALAFLAFSCVACVQPPQPFPAAAHHLHLFWLASLPPAHLDRLRWFSPVLRPVPTEPCVILDFGTAVHEANDAGSGGRRRPAKALLKVITVSRLRRSDMMPPVVSISPSRCALPERCGFSVAAAAFFHHFRKIRHAALRADIIIFRLRYHEKNHH